MTWNDLVLLVEQKMRQVGCAADELDIESIDSGVYPKERNLDLTIIETKFSYRLRIECHS